MFIPFRIHQENASHTEITKTYHFLVNKVFSCYEFCGCAQFSDINPFCKFSSDDIRFFTFRTVLERNQKKRDIRLILRMNEARDDSFYLTRHLRKIYPICPVGATTPLDIKLRGLDVKLEYRQIELSFISLINYEFESVFYELSEIFRILNIFFYSRMLSLRTFYLKCLRIMAANSSHLFDVRYENVCRSLFQDMLNLLEREQGTAINDFYKLGRISSNLEIMLNR